MRCMTSKALTYATGRPFESSDAEFVEPIYQSWRADGTFRRLVAAIVTSDVFRDGRAFAKERAL
jgi:hypothetical protein